MKRTTALRRLITRPGLDFLCEAHDGLSARIAAEAGFEALWASGLTIAASFGVRDNNELSWSQVVDHVAFMADAAPVPILLDGDTGYGNFNNVRRLVRKLEQVGVAGVTIEDKCFPKTNSFLRERQPLADVDEFCGRIKAAKDSQSDPDFVVVARVEALIAGWGLDEALRRAEAYHRTGADAILIHSKSSSPAEVFRFLDAWGGRSPVVLVPTKYWRTPTEDFRARGVSVVIWANHLLRAALAAMQATAARLHEEQSLMNVEPNVAPLHEVFRLQGDDELQEAERRYLPAARGLSAIVLAAGASGGFGGLGADRPKVMLKVRGRPILARLLEDLGHFGCQRVTVVRGYRAAAIDLDGPRYVDNADYAETSEAWSLALAADALEPGTLIAFGDIVLKRYIVQALLEEAGDGITLAVDSALAGRDLADRVLCDRPDHGRFAFDPAHLRAIGDGVSAADSHGVWIGLLHLGRDGAGWVREALDRLRATGALRSARLSHVLTGVLAAGHPVRVVYHRGGWVNVNELTDLLDASEI
jgi:phosphoenolpyruvate phosphomutase